MSCRIRVLADFTKSAKMAAHFMKSASTQIRHDIYIFLLIVETFYYEHDILMYISHFSNITRFSVQFHIIFTFKTPFIQIKK